VATAYVGTSGYVYNHWRKLFYPEGLPADDWFRFYCAHFRTVEINNSFYQLPLRSTFEKWKKTAPGGFIFTVKVSRFLTHMKKLKDPEDPLKRFLANARGLGRKLGPLLFQLPPNFKANLPRLQHLLALRKKGMQWVFEFRNKDWFRDEILDSLREGGAGFCVHDITEGCPATATASFAYLRLHGGETAAGKYDTPTLKRWAAVANRWLDQGLDVFVYFNNDIEGYAIVNAKELITLIGARALR
jgi:uncharacterized protein YecE (DUF72 family)